MKNKNILPKMSKQNSFLSFFFFKLLGFMLVFTAFAFVLQEVQHYNYSIYFEVLDYQITTYLGVLIFLFALILALILGLNVILSTIISKLSLIGEGYRTSRRNLSIVTLVESAILLAATSKKAALQHAENIKEDYLPNDLKGYIGLIKSLASSDSVPLALYGYVQKFPILSEIIAKKLAKIEYKLGNLDKALEYARAYFAKSSDDEQNNILLAQIYCNKKDWKAMNALISSLMEDKEISDETRNIFANLYIIPAREYITSAKNIESLIYCKKALDANPSNLEAAELFAELSASTKQYDVISDVLIDCFSKKPNFELFLIIKRFSKLENNDLYNQLMDSCMYENQLALFLSISIVLQLEERQQEILAKII